MSAEVVAASAVVGALVGAAAVVAAEVVTSAGASPAVGAAAGGGHGSASKGSSGGLQPSTWMVAVTEGCVTVPVTKAVEKVTISYFTGSTTGMLKGMLGIPGMPEGEEATVTHTHKGGI